ncbi:MAG: RNA-binding S4 domain-containing protein [Betaproteobacteria bacterium]|jgi:ribosome-associated heat shock protein Hsp15
MTDSTDRVRIDKWLWAARFFKTRSIAAEMVDGGRVQVNGDRVKPARALRVGDTLSIRVGPYLWTVSVLELSDRRGPASVAQKLYVETEQSRAEREEVAERLRANRPVNPLHKGRPTKRDRREMDRIREDGE